MNKFLMCIIGTILLMLFVSGDACAKDADEVVRVGVLAKRGKELCIARWGATANYLSEKIPHKTFELVPLAFTNIYPAVEQQSVDFLLANSAFYVAVEHKYGVNRIATLEALREGKTYNVSGGVIFARADRKEVNTLADIRGLSFMAVKDSSFGGWQTAWLLLKNAGLVPDKDFDLSFGGTHDAVVKAVMDGKVDVGTVRTDTLETMAGENQITLDDVKIIHQELYPPDVFSFLCSTELYPEWPFAKLPHVSDSLAEEVAIALLKMPPDSQAAKAANIAGWSPPLNYQLVHDCLKELRVGPYTDYGKIHLLDVIRIYWPWLVVAIVFVALSCGFAFYVIHANGRLRTAGDALNKELTERVKMERNMRQIFNTAGDGMRVVLTDRTIIEVNDQYCKMFRRSRDELIGTKCCDYSNNSAKCSSSDCMVTRTVKENARIEVDVEILLSDKKKIPCIITSVPHQDADGSVIGAIQNFKDISDRQVAQAAVEQEALQRGKIEMASSVLHDIGNAVTGIGTSAVTYFREKDWPELNSLKRLETLFQDNVSALKETLGDDKAQRIVPFMQKIGATLDKRRVGIENQFRGMAQAVNHINDILSLQRSYAQAGPSEHRRLIDLKDVLRDALAMQATSLEKRNIKTTLTWAEDIPQIKGDKTRLIQVLMNVLKNACEAFDACEEPDERTLYIAVTADERGVHVELKDNACGFDQMTASRLFEKNYSTKERDSGFGLYQCRSIITSHGGTMTLTSQGVGLGATMQLHLPKEEAKG